MIFITAILLFLSILYWWNLIGKNQLVWIDSVAKIIVIVCNFYLFGFLTSRWFQNGYFPLSNLYESLLFLTWCLTTVQLMTESKTASCIIGDGAVVFWAAVAL